MKKLDKNQLCYLYKITNLFNNKIYIGQTINPENRWRNHIYAIKKETLVISKAIKKYGSNNFNFEIIASCKTIDDADEIEIILIKQYGCRAPNGYNVAPGGKNFQVDPEYKKTTSEQISKTLKGRHLSPETEFKKGHRHSPETLKKLSESHKGIPTWNKGTTGIMKPNQTSFKPGHITWIKGTHITNSGSFKSGSQHVNAILNEEKVLEIIELHKQKIKKKEIAIKYGITISAIYNILQGKNWSHITGIPRKKKK